MLNIVGFGCGSYENMTIEAVRTIEKSELVVGFKTYIDLMRENIFLIKSIMKMA